MSVREFWFSYSSHASNLEAARGISSGNATPARILFSVREKNAFRQVRQGCSCGMKNFCNRRA
jgi:hypothetical protein